MNRRAFLRVGAGVASAPAVAGCTSRFETQPSREPPLVEERPDAVYYPTHIEEMEMAGMVKTDEYTFALAYSFPHRFWTVTKRQTEKVSVRDDDSIHLMMSVWDTDTRVVLPTVTQSVELTRDGETVFDGPLQPTLDPELEYHYGAVVERVEPDDTLTLSVEAPPQVSRHEGYETAFIEMPDMELTV